MKHIKLCLLFLTIPIHKCYLKNQKYFNRIIIIIKLSTINASLHFKDYQITVILELNNNDLWVRWRLMIWPLAECQTFSPPLPTYLWYFQVLSYGVTLELVLQCINMKYAYASVSLLASEMRPKCEKGAFLVH